MPNLHSALYAVRKTDDNEKCCITSHKMKISTLPIQNMQFRHLDSIIAQQLKKDRQHSPIAPHLQNLDGLCYDNIKANNQSFRAATIYKKNTCAVIIRKRQTHTDLAEYLHAACYGPVKSTFLQAVKKGFLKTWPGLSEKLVRKHLHSQVCTSKGHMSQTRQHLQSTKLNTDDSKYYLDNIKKNIRA